MIGPVMIALAVAALAALAGTVRWLTFSRAVHAGRFDDPIGAIFDVWLDRGAPTSRRKPRPSRQSTPIFEGVSR